MTREISLHPLARAELNKSTDYYAKVSSDLANRFLVDFEQAAMRLRKNPFSFALVNDTVRRLSFHKFPFFVFYSVQPDTIRVLAIAHQNRRPFYWYGRS